MSTPLCDACGAQPKWKSWILCRSCIDSSLTKECIICGCGPHAPMEHMRKVSLQRCSECHSQWYCGRDHQRTDWPFHKRFCDTLERMQHDVFLQILNEKTCIACGKAATSDKKLHKCSACHVVKYCSRKCQRDNFNEHSNVCERFLFLWRKYV